MDDGRLQYITAINKSKFIDIHSLQLSISFRDYNNKEGSELFPNEKPNCKEGDFRLFSGTDALFSHIKQELHNTPEIYLACGFDLTEPNRFKILNKNGGWFKEKGCSTKIKNNRIDNQDGRDKI